jgi:invasion protein IalB
MPTIRARLTGSLALLISVASLDAARAQAWVKVCDRPAENFNCTMQHVRLDAATGAELIGVDYKEAGSARSLTVRIPALEFRSPLHVALLDAASWKALSTGNAGPARPSFEIPLICTSSTCVGSQTLNESMQAAWALAGGVVFSARNKAGLTSFPVPLDGFKKVRAGPAMDKALLAAARAKLLADLKAKAAAK